MSHLIDFRVQDYRDLTRGDASTPWRASAWSSTWARSASTSTRASWRRWWSPAARCSTTASPGCATTTPTPARSRSATCSPTPSRSTSRGSSTRSSGPACPCSTPRTSGWTTPRRSGTGPGASTTTSTRPSGWRCRARARLAALPARGAQRLRDRLHRRLPGALRQGLRRCRGADRARALLLRGAQHRRRRSASPSHFTDDATHFYTRLGPHEGGRAIAEHAALAVSAIDGQWTIEDSISDGERVVIEWTMTWRHPESGERRLDRGTEWFEFRDGKIARCAPTTTAGRRTRAATCWASTTPAAATPCCERARVHQGGAAAPRARAAPAVHRRARGAARVDPPLRGRRAAPPRHRVGGRALVPERGVRASWRQLRLPRAQVPRGVRRRGRRLPARRRVRRGAGGLRLGRTWRPGSAPTSGSPPRRCGSSAPTSRSSASWCPRSGASGSPRSGSPSPTPAPTSPGSRRRAEPVDGGYVVNGSKTFITNGVRADFVVTAVKTTAEGGHSGLSFLLIERDMDGFTVSKKLEKMGWRASDTAELAFARRVRARREPARRGEQGLLPDHGQLPVGAAADGAGRGGLDAARDRHHGGLRAGAQRVRPPDRPLPGDPPQGRRDGAQARDRPRAHLPRATPVPRRPRRHPRGHDGQAGHPAGRVRGGRRRRSRSTAAPAT